MVRIRTAKGVGWEDTVFWRIKSLDDPVREISENLVADFGVSGFGCEVWVVGFQVSGVVFWVSGFGSRVSGFRSRVAGSGFQVSVSG